KRCDESFEIIEAAARIRQCDWGIRYSEGLGEDYPLNELDVLSRLLCADGLILAADGYYRAALGRCLASRELGAHIGDDTLGLYLVSLQADRRGQACIRRILGSTPPDAETLTWLQDQLASVRGAPQSPTNALKIDFEMALQSLRTNPKILARIRDRLVQQAEGESAQKRMRNLTGEELVALAQEPYAAFLDSALRVMEGEAPHEEKYEAIESLTRKLKDEFSSDPGAHQITAAQAGDVLRLYRLRVTDTSRVNALRVAMAVYLEKGRTGQLPAKLPDGLPKDPYSGQDFLYEGTEEGFVLRCQVKPFDKHRIQRFEFKVQQ
ncbi:MAG: hypothetical protein ACYS14_10445, partial [Planctomycetota bacterium]